MSIFSTMKISGSALTTQRLRMDIIANNIANINTPRTAKGEPYRRKRIVIRAVEQNSPFNIRLLGLKNDVNRLKGVSVVGISEDKSPLKLVYDPEHPDANAEGYVAYPNIDMVKEMVDMLSASRSYQANVTVLNSIKGLALRALDIGR